MAPAEGVAGISAHLEAVRRLNAGLRHPFRSSAIARWPVPVFPPCIIHARGDLVGVLQTATYLTATARHATEPAYA